MNKKIIASVLALFMFLLVGIQPVTAEPSAKDLLKEGDNYFKQGDYGKAIESYESILNLYPKAKEANDAKKKLADPKILAYQKKKAEDQLALEQQQEKYRQQQELARKQQEQENQQDNSESDFKFDWDKNVKNGVVITGYTGKRRIVRIPSIIQNTPVTSIGFDAFTRQNVTSVIIPDSVIRIEGKIEYTRVNTKKPDGSTEISNVRLVRGAAFMDCTSLTSVIIPNSVISIGDAVFYGCKSLTSITIPDSVTSIGENAFSGCESFTSVTIPNSVISIGDFTFSGCTSLASVTIPNRVTSIGENAFYRTSLISITIPDSVTSIGKGTFKGCTKLTSATISGSIGNEAFSGCTSLASITIGNKVTSIGDGAFNDCTSLTSVIFEGRITSNSFDNNAFKNLGDLRQIYLANDGGPGTYRRFAGVQTWKKQ